MSEWVPGLVPLNLMLLVLMVLSWLAIHATLMEKDLTLSQSRIWFLELVPATIFSWSVLYLLWPVVVEISTGELPVYVNDGIFFKLVGLIGAVVVTASSVGWIGLIPDDEEEEDDSAESDDGIRTSSRPLFPTTTPSLQTTNSGWNSSGRYGQYTGSSDDYSWNGNPSTSSDSIFDVNDPNGQYDLFTEQDPLLSTSTNPTDEASDDGNDDGNDNA
ncbi:hypothetical protein ACFPYI_20295 [Halomarina salina]|uniref:Transmembrane protein n=1 Tax=Halomarina salina TaxID=1872699 RepID=A0ABD5RSQ9_9EURY|nr:hypothetical protein [Halomarina salina]